MLLLIKYTLLYGIVLMLVALGGMFSEHSGIINIALEGIMVIGGVAGVLTLTMLPAGMVTLGVTTEVNLAGRAVASSAKPAAKESTWATPTVTSWATGLVRRT